MRSFRIVTLGCKVNRYESDALARQLRDLGWRGPRPGADPQLVIVNTCAVTGKASMQARQAVRRAIREFPSAQIVVTGCYAQASPEAIEEIPGVHLVVGQADKHRLTDRLSPPHAPLPRRPRRFCTDVGRERTFHVPAAAVFGSRTRPFLKIQDGCNAFCTYCIVPHTRGRSRSMPPDAVMDHLTALGRGGRREVVLTGIHLGCYGADLSPPTSLEALLHRIREARTVDRVRLSSIEPLELTDGVIGCVAEADGFCPHFHIPLQSGDPEILKRMHRPYTVEVFRERVAHIHRRMPEAAVGVDVLVGFPGEHAAAFRRTCDLIASLPVAYLHVFPFSPRPGTPAAGFADPVPAATVKERCRRLRRLGLSLKRRFYGRFVGRPLEILVEETRDAGSGLLKGVGANYATVLIEGGDHLKNRIVRARVDAAEADGTLRGSVIRGR